MRAAIYGLLVAAPVVAEYSISRALAAREHETVITQSADQQSDVVAVRLEAKMDQFLARAKELANEDAIERFAAIYEHADATEIQKLKNESDAQLAAAANYIARGAVARLVTSGGIVISSSIARDPIGTVAPFMTPAMDVRRGTEPFLSGRFPAGNAECFEFIGPVAPNSEVVLKPKNASFAVVLSIPAEIFERPVIDTIREARVPARTLVFDARGVCLVDSNLTFVGRRFDPAPPDVTVHWSDIHAFGEQTDTILRRAASSPHVLGALHQFVHRAAAIRIRSVPPGKLDILYVRMDDASGASAGPADRIALAIALLAGLVTFGIVFYRSNSEVHRVDTSAKAPILFGTLVFLVIFGATLYATRAFDERGRESLSSFSKKVEDSIIHDIEATVNARIAYFSIIDDQLIDAQQLGGEFYDCAKLANESFPGGLLALWTDEDNQAAEPISGNPGVNIDFKGKTALPSGMNTLDFPAAHFEGLGGPSPSLILDAPFRTSTRARCRIMWKFELSDLFAPLLTPERTSGFNVSLVSTNEPGRALFPLGSRIDMNQLGATAFRIPRDAAHEFQLALAPQANWFGTQTSRTIILYFGFILAFAGAVATAVVVGALGTYRRASRIDALTGLHNRIEFDEMLSREVARAKRHGHPLSLALIDLDHFKQVNDTHGHAVGDDVLCQVANELKQLLRSSDTVFRHGGEEFAILLPDTTEDSGLVVVERMRDHFARHEFKGKVATVTFSCGVAAWDGEETTDSLLARADVALYHAKTRGRNRVISARLIHLATALRAVHAAS
ncbi:MAG: GGDEF domain-containing protein [Planctomycetota bacterium]